MSDEPYPILFVYKGNAIVASRVLKPEPTTVPGITGIQATANLEDLPPGDYEYEISGKGFEPGKRWAFTLKA